MPESNVLISLYFNTNPDASSWEKLGNLLLTDNKMLRNIVDDSNKLRILSEKYFAPNAPNALKRSIFAGFME